MGNAAGRLARSDFWVMGVDDLMYPADTGFTARLRENIAGSFNHMVRKDKNRRELTAAFARNLERSGCRLANPAAVKPAELALALPALVQTLGELRPESLPETLGRLYGTDYSAVPADAGLVEAFDTARRKEVEIFIYTDTPSGKQKGEKLHVQRVLEAVGFDQEMIDYLRPRTYDLLDAVRAGHAASFARHSPVALRSFMSFAGIVPQRTLMADASLRRLEAGARAGCEALWVWNSEREKSPAEVSRARLIGAATTRHSGIALQRIAMAR